MAVKLCKEFGNNTKYSGKYGKYLIAKLALKRTPLFEENRI